MLAQGNDVLAIRYNKIRLDILEVAFVLKDTERDLIEIFEELPLSEESVGVNQ